MASADERTWRSRTLRAPTFAFAEAEGRKLRAQGKSLAEKVKEALLDPTNHQGITDARRAYGAFEEGQAWAGGTVFDDPRFRRQGEAHPEFQAECPGRAGERPQVFEQLPEFGYRLNVQRL